jgi:hypothetical protein
MPWRSLPPVRVFARRCAIVQVANTEVQDSKSFAQLVGRLDKSKPINVLLRRGEWKIHPDSSALKSSKTKGYPLVLRA